MKGTGQIGMFVWEASVRWPELYGRRHRRQTLTVLSNQCHIQLHMTIY